MPYERIGWSHILYIVIGFQAEGNKYINGQTL